MYQMYYNILIISISISMCVACILTFIIFESNQTLFKILIWITKQKNFINSFYLNKKILYISYRNKAIQYVRSKILF